MEAVDPSVFRVVIAVAPAGVVLRWSRIATGIEEMLRKSLAYLQKYDILLLWLHNEVFLVYFFTLIILQINDLFNYNLNFANYSHAYIQSLSL